MTASALIFCVGLIAADRPDLVVADFEGDDYGGWVATGEAFGDRPARGTLPGQMTVTGFLGRGLANSFVGGDRSTGTLASPEFIIERNYINFLIGGGAHAFDTCLELRVGDQLVRSASGPNDRPGGSEALDWSSWDVSDLKGNAAVLRVVDRATGGWGHVNVDQIIQSDVRRAAEPASRDMIVEARYLHVPVSNGAASRRVKVKVDGALLREFEAKLAVGPADFTTFLDLNGHLESTLRVEATLPSGSKALDALAFDEAPVREPLGLYGESSRPQFHFSSRRGWLNDPNGLVYFDGEYHLYYQHNPYGWDWGNMHWGHAVSPDLVHWTELPIALYPRAFGDWAFSGSAVVDQGNTSGLGTGGAPPLVGAFTSTGRGECVIFSNDRGRTWTEFAGNPVVKHEGRDPRLLWHGPSRRWVMAVYDEAGGARDIAFYTSPDLKAWTYASKISGFYECPDLFELPVEGQTGDTRWVLSGADGEYLLGSFDGHAFQPEGGKLKVWFGDYYAAQTFSNEPKGRRVQVGWNRGVTFPGMPFNQQMSVACELSLRPTPEGLRMFAAPVGELAALRGEARSWSDLALKPDEDALDGLNGDLFDINIQAEVGPEGAFTVDVRGTPVTYEARSGKLFCGKHSAPLALEAGVVTLRILVDRGSVEVFGNGGRVAVASGLRPTDADPAIRLRATTSGVRVVKAEAYPLKSAWPAHATR